MTDTKALALAAQVAPWTAEMRHALHRIPERGNTEFKTHALLMKTLEEIGIPFRTEKTWIIGEIKGGKPGKTVGIRADIDALPIQEETGVPFASEHPGMMHACGHDSHAAMLLGAAKALWSIRDEIPGTVRLFFQPAEETTGGARVMVQAGAMEGVDAVYAIHVAAQAPAGRIGGKPGPTHAFCDDIKIQILGKRGHGAHPSGGVDAVVIAAQVILALQTLITRNIEATDAAILTFGAIHGGTAANILCDEVTLTGTMRTLDQKVQKVLHKRLRETCEGVARAMGGDANVHIGTGYPAAINDEKEAARVKRIAERLFGEGSFHDEALSSMGGEDFGEFLKEAPGMMFNVGAGTEAPLHNEHFKLDDACLEKGVAMHIAVTMDYLEEGK